jgi:hypothetical protein
MRLRRLPASSNIVSKRSSPGSRFRCSLARAGTAAAALLFLGLLAPLSGWPQESGGDDDLKLPRDMLVGALNARVQPIQGFTIPGGNAEWHVGIYRLSQEAFFVDYVIAAGAPFQVQAILCDRTKGGEKSIETDSTILGPTETAGEFFDANLTYAYYPPDVTPPCMLMGMSATIRNGVIRHEWETAERKAYFATAPERVVRHMANWSRYLLDHRKDRRRAAQFFAAAMQREADELAKLAQGGDKEETASRLVLLEEIFPPELFDLELPLTSAQAADASRFLQQRLQLRRRVAATDAGAPTLIKRDQALLARYSAAR